MLRITVPAAARERHRLRYYALGAAACTASAVVGVLLAAVTA